MRECSINNFNNVSFVEHFADKCIGRTHCDVNLAQFVRTDIDGPSYCFDNPARVYI
jgi:hypothetical protein